jgi:uncharacterized protein YbjT (DUF2867 family)
MIAVMGAAGNVGSKVADVLVRAKEEVRVFEHRRKLEELRQRGAEVVTGDALDARDLERLFKGARAALVLLPENVADPDFVANRSKMGGAIVEALRTARVGHVVLLSAVGADRADAAGPPAGLHEFEQRLTALQDASVLALRSAFYMDYLLANLPLIRAQKLNGSAIKGDLKYPMVATRDVAREAAERLRLRDFSGHQVKMLLGPEDLSMREATAAIGARLGLPDLPYIEFPADGVKGALMGAGMSEEVASLIVEMQLAINSGRPFGDLWRTPESTTPTRLDEFLREALSPEAVGAEAGGKR